MDTVLKHLQPTMVFHYFEEISQIPRGSGNEKAISDYLVDFAKKHNLEYVQDSALNVVIRKPAYKGYENAAGVILQGHMDMVCEKNKNTVHDFINDPLKLRVQGDMIYATDTTLGADNGIAVAYSLAILASDDIPHPPLTVLITSEEETGLNGAAAVSPKHLAGKYLINIDSEEEGKLLVSCSGGARMTETIPIEWEKVKPGLLSYGISISGLKGGHSGMEIDKGRGNSNKLLGRILYDLCSIIEYDLKEVTGGSKMNAIPREAQAVILVESGNVPALATKIEEWNRILQNEFRISDKDVAVSLERIEYNYAEVFSEVTKHNVLAALLLIPNGVQTMSMDIPGLVESSTNLGVVSTTSSDVHLESATRSSVKSRKKELLMIGQAVAAVTGGDFSVSSDYPEWEYNPESNLRKLFEQVFQRKYGRAPEIIAIHAGVECGLFSEKVPELDMISFGPDVFDVHTPDEHISISSTLRTWEYLLEVLAELK